MVLLTDGEKISKISLFVLAQLTNVTDRRTDRHRVTAIAALCIASHGKNQIHLLVRIIICSFHLPVPWHYMRSIGSRAPWLDESPVASCVWVVLFSFSDCRQLANFVNVLATDDWSVCCRSHSQTADWARLHLCDGFAGSAVKTCRLTWCDVAATDLRYAMRRVNQYNPCTCNRCCSDAELNLLQQPSYISWCHWLQQEHCSSQWALLLLKTRSSAIAERSCDASCCWVFSLVAEGCSN